MNIVVIPEDPTYDRHIVQPIIQAMMTWIGKSNATIRLPEGNLGGTGSALDWASLEPIVNQYQYLADLFLLCVDRDGDAGRRDSLNYLEEKAQNKLANEGFGEIAFFAVAAQQEIEVWALGGISELPTPDRYTWDAVRSDSNAKERYFRAYVERSGLIERQFEDRKILGETSAAHYKTLRQKCPELEKLEKRIQEWLNQ